MIFLNHKSLAEQLGLSEYKFGGNSATQRGQLTEIPGPGGVIVSERPLSVLLKGNQGFGFRPAVGSPDGFLNNVVCAILEPYFVSTARYTQRHIPLPLGTVADNSAYLMEFVPGTEGFSENFIDVEELYPCANAFLAFGINLLSDCNCAEDGDYAKNIMIWGPQKTVLPEGEKLPATWMRIDFDNGSLTIDWQRFTAAVETQQEALLAALGAGPVQTLLQIAAYYTALVPKTAVPWLDAYQTAKTTAWKALAPVLLPLRRQWILELSQVQDMAAAAVPI